MKPPLCLEALPALRISAVSFRTGTGIKLCGEAGEAIGGGGGGTIVEEIDG